MDESHAARLYLARVYPGLAQVRRHEMGTCASRGVDTRQQLVSVTQDGGGNVQEVKCCVKPGVKETRCANCLLPSPGAARRANAAASEVACPDLPRGVQKFLARAEELLKDDPKAMEAVERINAAAEKVRSGAVA